MTKCGHIITRQPGVTFRQARDILVEGRYSSNPDDYAIITKMVPLNVEIDPYLADRREYYETIGMLHIFTAKYTDFVNLWKTKNPSSAKNADVYLRNMK